MAKCRYCGASVLFIGKRKGGAFGGFVPNICDVQPIYVSYFSSPEKARIYITPYGTMINGEENVNGDRCYRLHNCRGQADFALDPFFLREKKVKEDKEKADFEKKYERIKGTGIKAKDKRSYNINQFMLF